MTGQTDTEFSPQIQPNQPFPNMSLLHLVGLPSSRMLSSTNRDLADTSLLHQTPPLAHLAAIPPASGELRLSFSDHRSVVTQAIDQALALSYEVFPMPVNEDDVTVNDDGDDGYADDNTFDDEAESDGGFENDEGEDGMDMLHMTMERASARGRE